MDIMTVRALQEKARETGLTQAELFQLACKLICCMSNQVIKGYSEAFLPNRKEILICVE